MARHVEYVIASYMGSRIDKTQQYEIDRSWLLKQHLESLSRLSHSVDRITIAHSTTVTGTVAHGDLSWMDEIPREIRGVPVRVMLRPNVGMSYGAYVDTIEASPEASHFILIEDDYIFASDDFDAWMIDRIQASGMVAGAVWDWSLESSPALPTATVFIGAVEAESIRASIRKGWNGSPVFSSDPGYRSGYYGQVAMSQAIVQSSFGLVDWLDDRSTAFWNSTHGSVEWFEEGDEKPSFVVPIQAIDRVVPFRRYRRSWADPGPTWSGMMRRDGTFLKI